MTKYREILRLHSLGLSQRNIALSCSVSKTTVNRVVKRAVELNLSWPLDEKKTEAVLSEILFSSTQKSEERKRPPNFDYVRSELLKNGVSKKLLWTEYMEECRLNGEESLPPRRVAVPKPTTSYLLRTGGLETSHRSVQLSHIT